MFSNVNIIIYIITIVILLMLHNIIIQVIFMNVISVKNIIWF